MPCIGGGRIGVLRGCCVEAAPPFHRSARRRVSGSLPLRCTVPQLSECRAYPTDPVHRVRVVMTPHRGLVFIIFTAESSVNSEFV